MSNVLCFMFIECDKMDSDIQQVEKEKYIRAKGQKKKSENVCCKSIVCTKVI